MKRRRFRRFSRRKPKTFWIDTFQDANWQLIDCFPGYDTDPAHNKVLVVPLIRTRLPQAVEDISSVLEGKDEGFRLRRIVGDLTFLAGSLYISNTEARAAFIRYITHIRWGIMVHPINADRNFDNLANGKYVFNPAESVSQSDPWLIERSITLSDYGPWDRDANNVGLDLSLRDTNYNHLPSGTFVDVNVNRRVKSEEDVSLFITWNADLSPGGVIDAVFEPYYKSNLRMLISR